MNNIDDERCQDCPFIFECSGDICFSDEQFDNEEDFGFMQDRGVDND